MVADIGHVWLAGAGPGDPGLITVAAAQALAHADVVVFDALANPVLLRGARRDAELIDAGKRAGRHGKTQDEIEALIVERARAGKRVLRLKGGDPFVFGRGGEEALACAAAGVPFTIIPGVTSAIAAPAYAGIPVTHRGLSSGFMVVTGNEAGDSGPQIDWAAAAHADTLLILMGAASLEQNMRDLVAAGRDPDTPAACVQWGTRHDQRSVIGTVGTVAGQAAEAGAGSPMVTVVGPVVSLADAIAWFRPAQLAGRSVVVTRSRDQASGLVRTFESLGADVLEAPAFAANVRESAPELAEGVAATPDWIVVSSANGVAALFACLGRAGKDARALHGSRIAAVGEATAGALASNGLRADFIPSRATGEALGLELPLERSETVLLVASNRTGPELAERLRSRGAVKTTAIGYDTVAVPLSEEDCARIAVADAITFAAASTVGNLWAALGDHRVSPATKLVSIGPRTSAALVETFGRVDAEAQTPGIDALVAATVEELRWE